LPIRAELRIHYGPEWRTIVRPRILLRAGNRCEFCGKPNSVWIETTTGTRWSEHLRRRTHFMYWRRMTDGDWYTQRGRRCPGRPAPAYIKSRLIKVVLGVMHLDHTPGNDSDDNLRASCQWCHLLYDKEHHRESRETRKDEARPMFHNSPTPPPRAPMVLTRKWPVDRRSYLLETGRVDQLEKEELALSLELPARLTLSESELGLLLRHGRQVDQKKR
jgi:hypothetical protein